MTVCYGGNSKFAEELRPIINALGMRLIAIHEWDTADIKWQRNTWLEHLRQADIVICPANYRIQPAKSSNRLIQAMSLGKPVVCSPLPAYLDVLGKFPGSFFIAESPEEWKGKLQLLRDDPDLRKLMGEKARAAAQSYSIDAIGQKWLNVLQERDPIDIVIPTYKNLRGIRHCIESIKTCTSMPYRIIVVNNGIDEELHQYLSSLSDITYIKTGRLNFAQAVNQGIKAGTSKFVCILNDDVILSRNCLDHMVEVCTGNVGGVGPLSNCDKGWLHNYDISIGGVDLLPGCNTLEQIEPVIPQIYSYRSLYNETFEREWVAFYCTVIPREVINKIGLLNEEYTNSGEDVDMCRRIRAQGYQIIQTFKAFCFHFGAVSRKMLEKEDPGSYHAADHKTNAHLRHLWDRKSVMIYSGPSWERWDYRIMETSGIGGSEVWQISLARELDKLGYRVTSFADCETELMDGDIQWIPYTQYPKWAEQHWTDYAILSRTTDPLRFPLRAGKVFVMIHDVWLLSDRNQLFLDRVNKFCALSQWHLDFASDYHKIPKEKMVITSNGIDPARFDSIKVDRHPFRFHWSSSLDRGLDNVLYLWPFIKNEIPGAELHVFYGTWNWRQSCIQKNDQEGLKKIDALEVAMTQPGVFNHGRINQRQLAEEICKSSLWLYPTWFSESFCITAIECQYAGVPVIASKYGGLTTTLGDSAILLGNGDAQWAYTKEGREAFYNETVSMLRDRAKWELWSQRGRENAAKYSWTNCALRWKALFEE